MNAPAKASEQGGGPLTALVTGGSSGIGEAVAVRLAGMGHRIVLVSENQRELERVRGRVLSEGAPSARVLCVDLAAEGAAEEVFTWCRQGDLEVDVLVNCAGIFANADDEIEGSDRVDALLKLHVVTLTHLCLLFGAEMIRRGGGYILNVSSISSLFPDPSSLTYGPSKRYVLAFSRMLHLHWREHEVRVTCLVPGAVDTDFFRANNITLPSMVRSRLMKAERCAAAAVRGLFRGKAVVLPGLWSGLHAGLFRLLLRPALYTRLKRAYLAMRRRRSSP